MSMVAAVHGTEQVLSGAVVAATPLGSVAESAAPADTLLTAPAATLADKPLAAPATKAPRGRLELGISARNGRSYASSQFHEGALRILRPHYLDDSGQVCYVLINPGGAYLGGDLFLLDVVVEKGADLLLTTQSATKVYRTPGSFAEQQMRVTLREGARLELMPDQLIAYREACYRQVSSFTVQPSSSLVMAEVVTPGWSPDGAAFRYEEIRLRNSIWVQADAGPPELLALDNLLIQPPASDVTGLGFMEGCSHLGSLLVVDARVNQALADELHVLTDRFDALTGVSLTRTVAGTTGLVLRALGNSTDELNRLLAACTTLLRERWTGQQPLTLRKH
ncbi:Urease accessory protein UreD [Arthrobacter ulcerisalmonis]|uniref:Urease accessory protein UreD n=1 Tax=Arthrobacter ulcerisalmonis TaxID=2483813 RepID=A0A3P5W550_9MICC|nr:Urease accessory protein UreD [Arthrobacter ulcerisalmonis]